MTKIYFDKARLEKTLISVFEPPITNTRKDMDCDLFEIYDCIKRALVKQTNTLRSFSDGIARNEYKKNDLPYCTFSGSFSSRGVQNLIQHSNLICIDLDKLPTKKLSRVKMFIMADPHLLMCFISPSGEGLKVIYPIDITLGSQQEWYERYVRHIVDTCYVDEEYIDKGCKDISRACFLCYDPEIFLNPEIGNGGRVYPVDLMEEENLKISYTPYIPYASSFDYDIDFENRSSENNFLIMMKITEKEKGPYEHPRYNWILSLVGRCHRLGIDMEKCLEYTLLHFKDHPASTKSADPLNIQRDIIYPIKSIYSKKSKDFGTWLPKSKKNNEEEDNNTQLFPLEIYEKLPLFLKTLCSKFNDRDKDVFFISLLGVLSACFKNVSGVYSGFLTGTNLYTFVTAPPGAGKGLMKWAEKLILPIHDEIREQSEMSIEYYEEKLNEYNEDKNLPHPGKHPKHQILLIPANTSGTGILQTVADNGGSGIIFETEADTLSSALSKEWGDFSEFLRKAFHHETVSYKRRVKNEYVQITEPRFSMVLSGTPQQVINLIPNTENGLFSRFCFYAFDYKAQWKNPFEGNGMFEMTEFIKSQSLTLKQYYSWIKAEPKITFNLTAKQQQFFNEVYTKRLEEFYSVIGADIVGSILRLGIITFRISMLLSIFRMIEHGTIKDFIECGDEDFEAAIAITDVLQDHTAYVYQSYRSNSKAGLKPEPLKYFQILPELFERKRANEIAGSIGLNPKTAERYLEVLMSKKLLFRVKHGHYSKKITAQDS